MNKVSITLATRGRPERVVETVNISCSNWRHPNTSLWVMVDDDDIGTVIAVQNAIPRWKAQGKTVHMDVRKREDTIAEKWNRVIKLDPADVYLTAADDDPHITPGYDVKVLEAASVFPDGIGMVYGHPANYSFSKVVGPTAKLVEKMGFIFPEYFPFWFVDHWTDDLAKMIGRICYADVNTDQGNVGKTQEMRETAWWATWFDAAYLFRRQQAIDIINSPDFQSPEWEKNVLIRNPPLIEFKTRWINSGVRDNAGRYDLWSGLKNNDPRYLRVKQRAMDMVPSFLDDYGMSKPEADWFRKYLLPQKIAAPAQQFAKQNSQALLMQAHAKGVELAEQMRRNQELIVRIAAGQQ